MNEFVKELKIDDYKIKFLPFKRAQAMYQFGEGDVCFTGGDEKISQLYIPNYKREDFLYSEKYMRVPSKIFSYNKEYCDINELSNKAIIRTQNFPVYKFIDKSKIKNMYDLGSFENALKMLKSNRGEAIITFFPSNSTFLKDLKYCKEKSLTIHFDTIQCKNTKNNKKFIKEMNSRIIKMKKEKLIFKLMNKYYPGHVDQFHPESIKAD